MTNSVKQKIKTVKPSTLGYKHPYFVPIDDGDEETIKYYKRNNVPVAYIALPGRTKHYYAVFDADTQEKADEYNRMFGNFAKKDYRQECKTTDNETSYDSLLKTGHDATNNVNDIEEMVFYKTLIDALNKELNELTEEKSRVITMVANKESQYSVAKELGISRSTVRDRKNKVLKELKEKLKKYQ